MVLGARFGAEAAGLAAMTIKVLAAPATLICGSLLDVFRHAASAEYSSSRQCLSTYRSTLKLALPLAVAIALPVLAFGPWLFATVLGAQWRVSGEFGQIMSALLFLRVLSNPVSHAIYLAGKAHQELWWQLMLFALVATSLAIGASAIDAIILYTASYCMMYLLYLALSYRAAKGGPDVALV